MKIATGNHYLAFVLSKEQRNCLLAKYRHILYRHTVEVTHHITIAYNFTEEDVPTLQKFVDNAKVFQLNGLLCGDGISTFKVLIDGVSKRPIEDNQFHITASRSKLRKSSDSNDLLNGEIPTFETFEANDELHGKFYLIPKGIKSIIGGSSHHIEFNSI